MRRIVILSGIVILVIILLAIYVLLSRKNGSVVTSKNLKSISPTAAQKKDTGLDLISYNSTTSAFSIKYPKDVKHEMASFSEIFSKMGTNQKDGEILTDGILLTISRGKMTGKTFKDFVDKKYIEIVNNPTKPILGGKIPMNVAGIQGIAFTVKGISEKVIIFLPKGDKEYLEIVNETIAPKGKSQNYQKIVDQILSSIKYTE